MIRYYEDISDDPGRWVSLEYAYKRCSWEHGPFKGKTFEEFKEAVNQVKKESFMEGGVDAEVSVDCFGISSSW